MTTEVAISETNSHETNGIWKECSNCGWRGTVDSNRKKLCPECGDRDTMEPSEIHVKADGTPLTIVGEVTRVSRTKSYRDGYNEVEKYFIFTTDDEGNEHKASVIVAQIIHNFEHREYREANGADYVKPFSGDRISYLTWNEKKGWGSVLGINILEASGKDDWIAAQRAQEKAVCQGQCGKCTMRTSQAGNQYLFCNELREPVFKAKKYCDIYGTTTTEAKLIEGRKSPSETVYYIEKGAHPGIPGFAVRRTEEALKAALDDYREADIEAYTVAVEDGYTIKTAPVIGGKAKPRVFYVITWNDDGVEWNGEFYATNTLAINVKNSLGDPKNAHIFHMEVN